MKLSIVVGAGYFIYKRVFNDENTNLDGLLIKDLVLKNKLLFLLIVLLSILNWLLEIRKWQVLVSSFHNISFLEALKQSLSSHTLSIITPFKSGEYGGKALYYPKNHRGKIVFLNFIGNTAQLVMTLLFGSVGIVYFFTHFDVPIHPHKIRRIAYVIAFLLLAVFVGNNHYKNKKGNFYNKALLFFKNISMRVKLKISWLSFLRYLVFSHQFYLLILLFGIEIQYIFVMMLVFSMYFIATMLPVISLFDFVIKGSIAIYLFSFLHVDKLLIVFITTLMWLLNFAAPAILGSYYILRFKPKLNT